MARKGLSDWLTEYGLTGQGESILRGTGTDEAKAAELTRLFQGAGAEGITVNKSQVYRWRQAAGVEGNRRESTEPETVTKPKRTRGGQPGNQNGVGHGAPRGNKNAVVTGEYETLWDAGLSEREQIAMREAWRLPTLEQINRQLGLIDVRIGRALERVRQTREALALGVELQLERRSQTDGTIMGQDMDTTTTTMIHTREVLDRQEKALDRMMQRRERMLAIRAMIELHLLKRGLGHNPAGDINRDEGDPDLSGLNDEELDQLEHILAKTAQPRRG